MTSDITLSTFDEQLGRIAQTFFNNSTGGAYDVKIPETREYKEFEAAVKQLIASEVIPKRVERTGREDLDYIGAIVNQVADKQLKALGIEQTNKEKSICDHRDCNNTVETKTILPEQLCEKHLNEFQDWLDKHNASNKEKL